MNAPADLDFEAQPVLGFPLRLGIGAVLVFVVGFLIWGSLAPLNSAATATGQLRVDSYRKPVQHLEGGIVRAILVKDGDTVQRGQVLVRLDDVQASAATGLVGGQRDAFRMLQARLIAERDGRGSITLPADLQARMREPAAAQMIAGQTRIFESRRRALTGESDVLGQRIAQLRSEELAYRAQVASAEEQIRLSREELLDVVTLYERGLTTKPRKLALERAIAQLEGSKGQQLGLIARTQQAIGETRIQISNLRAAQANEVATELRDVETKLAELEERFGAAADVRRRMSIVAPASGRVVGLRPVADGSVIAPGETLMEIVPQNEALAVDARVSAYDIDSVRAGMTAEVKLTAFKQQRLPIMIGEVVSVSADALYDERSGTNYYLAKVELPADALNNLRNVRLQPGMPVEVFIITGKKSALAYLLDPLTDSFRRGLREE